MSAEVPKVASTVNLPTLLAKGKAEGRMRRPRYADTVPLIILPAITRAATALCAEEVIMCPIRPVTVMRRAGAVMPLIPIIRIVMRKVQPLVKLARLLIPRV